MNANKLSKLFKDKLPLSIYIIEPESINTQFVSNSVINKSSKYNTNYFEKEKFYKAVSKII